MITTAGLLKIMDFGVARPFSSNLTSQHEIVGSAPYMAPEVWLGREVSFQADLYSLGVMVYELITGMVPFEAEGAAEMMCKHLEVVPVSPEVLNTAVPLWLAETIMKQLRKSACDRASSAQDLAGMIETRLGAGSEQINFTQRYINISQDFEMRGPLMSQDVPLDRAGLRHDGLPLVDSALSGGASLTGYDWCENELPEISAAVSNQTVLSQV
jgi:serine/threonine protein kinase